MIVLQTTETEVRKIVTSALSPPHDVVVVEAWDPAISAASRSELFIVVAAADRNTALETFQRSHPEVPIIGLFKRSERLVQALCSLSFRAVLWLPVKPQVLRSAVENALIPHPLRQMANMVEANSRMPRKLKMALVQAFLTNPPLLTVSDLADRADCHRTTLNRQWRRICPAPEETLKDLLDIVVLERAMSIKRPGRSWREPARKLGVSEQRLARIGHRLVGGGLRHLARLGSTQIQEVIEIKISRLLTGASQP